MTRALMFAALLLAACSPEAEAPPKKEGESAPAPAAETAPTPELTGSWDVTSYNGAPLTQVFDMVATFDGGRLTIASDCVRLGWTYTQNRGLVTFQKASTTECARGRTNSEDQIEEALGSVTIALFSEDGREVQLSGSGGTVAMKRR